MDARFFRDFRFLVLSKFLLESSSPRIEERLRDRCSFEDRLATEERLLPTLLASLSLAAEAATAVLLRRDKRNFTLLFLLIFCPGISPEPDASREMTLTLLRRSMTLTLPLRGNDATLLRRSLISWNFRA